MTGGCIAGTLLFLALAGSGWRLDPPPLGLALSAAAIAAGEELLWRGLALPHLADGLGAGVAVVLTSLAFAITHVPAQGRRAALVHTATGLVFGGAFVASGLTCAIAAHVVYNLLAVAARSPALTAAAIIAEGIEKRFGATYALTGLDLRVGEGEVVALLGPNGAGKTTFVSLVLGLRRQDRGSLLVLGELPGSRTARCQVAATPQEMSFPPTLKVGEILDFVLAHHRDAAGREEVLERFGLHEFAGRQAGGISGGQRRRLAVALAFARSPRLAVLDEPSAGLDVETRLAVWQSIREYAGSGGTVLLTTHRLDEAEQLASRIVVLGNGRVRADGTAAELTADGDRSLQDAYLLLTGAAR